MTLSLIPVGPQVPQWAAAILQSMADAVSALQQPGSPTQEYAADTKARLLAQAPPDKWQNCRAIVTDQGLPVWSINLAGTWTWVKADGTAL